ncbi:MAG: GH3 auxin-responsive promoter family protein [Aureispira sp.]
MSIKTALVAPFAKVLSRRVQRDAVQAEDDQQRLLAYLIKQGRKTAYGQAHGLSKVQDYQGFQQQIPLVGYEALQPYIARINQGEKNVLWPGRPRYYAKTSGTTSGAKYIPLTKASLPNHFGTARNALFHYMAHTGQYDFMDGKLMFLSGSPTLDDYHGIATGRLSGISNHLIPSWLKRSQLPSYSTNCIDDWETKLDKIVEETATADLRLISGIPPWVHMYYERLLEYTGKKTIMEVFPNLSMFVYGGVNFEPYRASLEHLVGQRLPSVETYPASEGFLAFQDQPDHPALLLNTNAGIFFEFVPLAAIHEEKPPRLALHQVEVGVDYAIILTTNAGLWGYEIGDTVRFVSTRPYRILVTGRVKHFISAFGEHVIGKEVETALLQAAKQAALSFLEFTVAPQVNPPEGVAPYHEWFIAFEQPPTNLEEFARAVDEQLQAQNSYYKDLRAGKVLQALKIRSLQPAAFQAYMKSIGKLGGQNKVPRLSNDRKIANFLQQHLLQ